MNFLDQLNHYLILFAIILGVVCVVIGGLAFYLVKVKKILTNETVSNIDYDNFEKTDTLEYAKFEDIVTNAYGEGMIVQDNGTRFVAAIGTGGFDFYNANSGEQLSVMAGMISFINLIDKPIVFRQSTKGVDIREVIKRHEEQLEKVKIDYLTLNDRFEALKVESEHVDDDNYSVYYNKLKDMKKTLKALDFSRKNLEEEIRYMTYMQGIATFDQVWMYDWVYNENEYTHKLTEQEIYEKAMQQLGNKGNSLINALSRCNVPAERLSGEELVELARRHNHPVSAERMSMKSVLGTAWEELVVTSDSADEMAEQAAYENGVSPEEIINLLKTTSSVTGSKYREAL